MPESVVYRYSITLSYSSARSGLTEVRVWIYSEDKNLFSERNLEGFSDELMDYLDINRRLQGVLGVFSPEEGVPLSRSEMELSGHRLNKFYGFAEFKRGSRTSRYYSVSSNGRHWSRSSPFRTALPKRLTKRELERRVLRKFVKPRVVRRVVISKKKWTSILRQAKVLKDPTLRRIASGKLRWAGKTQAEINEAMAKVRTRRYKP